MDNLAQPFGAKVSQFSIDWNTPTNVNRRQSGINIGFILFIIGSNQFEFIRPVQPERISAALAVVLPLAKSNETRARYESLCVVIQDIARAWSGNKPPDNDLFPGALLIDIADFKFVKRLPKVAAIAELDGTGNPYSEIQCRF